MNQEVARRRFSNLFNPPEIYNEESPSDSSTEELAVVEPTAVVEAMDTDTSVTKTLNDNKPSESTTVEPTQEQPPLRRSSRKKIRTSILQISEVPNRPVKLSANSSDSAIKKYYLDKKVKRLNPSLETIYEEPQVINNEVVVMSTRKFKRMIAFDVVAGKNSSKVKKRKTKTKNLKNKKIMKKVTMEFFNKKLQQIDE